MPTETFLRLPEEKRCRIFEAAVDEFAACHFPQASINRIIKAAGIPRGSFYQYFFGKEDLYVYVLQEIGKEKIDIVAAIQAAVGKEQNFYDLLSASLPSILEWAELNPRYSRIGMRMLEDEPNTIQNVFDDMTDSVNYVRQLLLNEEQASRLRPGVSVETVLQLILSASLMIMRDFFTAKDVDEARSRLLAIYDIICYGAMRQAEGV